MGWSQAHSENRMGDCALKQTVEEKWKINKHIEGLVKIIAAYFKIINHLHSQRHFQPKILKFFQVLLTKAAHR